MELYKPRLVSKGYRQEETIDFNDTFFPVVKMVTVHTILALAICHGWNIWQIDVNNTFLQGDLTEDVYMEVPQGFITSAENFNKVCKLVKSLYGLKQASRQWNIKLTNVLVSHGYEQSHLDYSIFILLLVYVYDLLTTGSTDRLVVEQKKVLHHHLNLKDLDELQYFLGLEIARSMEGIVVNQCKYALELISDAGLVAAKLAFTLMDQNKKLTTSEYD